MDADSLKKDFIRHGLAPDEVSTSVEDLERAILDYTNGKAMRLSAIREFGKTLDEANEHLQRLDALVANTLSDNPTPMASWNIARSVNRPVGRKAAPKASDPPAATPPVPPPVIAEPAAEVALPAAA